MDYSREGTKKRKRKLSPHNERIKNKIGITFSRVVVAFILIAGFALVGAGMGLYMGILNDAPEIDPFAMSTSLNYTSIVYNNKTGAEVARMDTAEDRVYVTFDQIPKHVSDAFVAIEDERFYSHNGIDIEALGRVALTLVTKGEVQGASTITQQLIKNKLDRFESTIVSKLQEQYLAVEYEKFLTEHYGSKQIAKETILEYYLNEINLGRNCYGVQAAANRYYGKDVSELTIAEAATIAAITQNPYRFPPDRYQENDDNMNRASDVLDLMLKNNLITQEQFDDATVYREDIDSYLIDPAVYTGIIHGANLDEGLTGIQDYYLDAVQSELQKDLMTLKNLSPAEASNLISRGGLQIFICQDEDMQRIVDAAFLNADNFSDTEFEIDVEYRLSTQNTITKAITNHRFTDTFKTDEQVDEYVRSKQNEVLTANDIVLEDRIIKTPQPQASFVIIDYHTGQVKALSGGRGEKSVSLSFNRATQAKRSPGSQFKPLVSYAPALDLGRITAATVIDDIPSTYTDRGGNAYSPRNWWGDSRYEGLSTVRKGIWHSMNVVAVKNMMQNSSIDTSYAYLKNFGFTTLIDGNGTHTDMVPSLPLGGLTDGVYPVELAAAYGAIANGGVYNKPIYYTKVLDHDGNILLENKQEDGERRVIADTTAYLLTDMMRDTVRIGTGTAIAFQEVNMPIAGKTGTSTDSKDLGFTAYTPYYVANIWMGYDHQKKINDDDHHKMIWRNIMEEVHRNLPTLDFERPNGIVTASVCRDSGLLATELCSRDPRGGRVYTEMFATGTVPTEYCDCHQEVKICTVSGQRASYSCPANLTETRVGIVRKESPAAVNPWGRSYNLDDLAYDITGVVNGPECEYHTKGGLLYDENGNPYYDPAYYSQYGGLIGQNQGQYPGIDNYFNWGNTPTPTPYPEFYIPPADGSATVPGLITPPNTATPTAAPPNTTPVEEEPPFETDATPENIPINEAFPSP
jgi:penicillin-binding protein 1A